MTHKMKHATRTDESGRLMEEARTRLKKRGGELFEEAQDRGKRAIRNTRAWITRNPGAAVGAAFLIGAAAAALVRRRRKG